VRVTRSSLLFDLRGYQLIHESKGSLILWLTILEMDWLLQSTMGFDLSRNPSGSSLGWATMTDYCPNQLNWHRGFFLNQTQLGCSANADISTRRASRSGSIEVEGGRHR
jgi:hypothetical protein